MSDTTRVVSTRNLTKAESIQFIRALTVTLTLAEARPNTKLWVFFGTDDVTSLCNHPTNAIGTPLLSDTIGGATIELNIPNGRFITGNYDITVADTDNLGSVDTLGSVYGFAKGSFSSTGTVQFFQTTLTTITTVEREVVNNSRDPLAQSFFTFGIPNGMFLSSIDIYFQTKDADIPVRLEIRPLVNGYPGKLEPNNINFISVKAPADVNISTDASAITKFTFDPPIFLAGETEHCFVLIANSNQYNVFTSKMGESSIEDGYKIYENPYIGSLFKSENNITWSAEQFEDIKFTINRCEFSTGTNGIVTFNVDVPHFAAFGSQFSTTSGSNVVRYTHTHEHGLESSSKINIVANTLATYNGIIGANLNGLFTVVNVIDRNTIEFQVATNATSTGILTSSDIITEIQVDNGGINHGVDTSISFTGGGGVGAVAVPNITGGIIKSVTITNPGSGFTSAPAAIVTSIAGTGAMLVPIITPAFSVGVNKPMTNFTPNIAIYTPNNTKTINSISTTLGNYDGGNLVTYNPGKDISFLTTSTYDNIDQNSLIASSFNETAMMAGTESSKVTVELISSDSRVSPIFITTHTPEIIAYSKKISNQSGEVLTSSNPTGVVVSYIVSNGGSGYTVDPIATITGGGGINATATCVRIGSALSQVDVTTAGTGFTSVPTVVITRGSGDTTGVGAASVAVLSDFNTELLSTGGSSKSRYITKKNTLQTISTGVRVFAVIASTDGSSVDWYVRTSLSGSNSDHSQLSWTRLNCPAERNKSSSSGELFEYQFILENLANFDTYDLKCVLLTNNPTNAPVVASYRVIVTA